MTRIARISFIAITFATGGFAMLSHGASASTGDTSCSGLSTVQVTRCCARYTNQDTTACREAFVRIKKRQLTARLIKDDDGGGAGGKGGKGGRGGQK